MPNVKKRFVLFAVSLLAAALWVGNLSAAPFANGNFESNAAHISPPWQQLTIGTWGTNHGPYGLDPPQVGSFYAELGNPGSGAGGIFQTFDSSPNSLYSISLWASGWDGYPNHTGYFAVGSGTWDGTVTPGTVNPDVVPHDELAVQTMNIDRNAVNAATGNVDGWNYIAPINFATGSGTTSTITFWNNDGSAARVDNIVLTLLASSFCTSNASGAWGSTLSWSSTPSGIIPDTFTATTVNGSNTVTIGASDSPAAASLLKVNGGTVQLTSGTLTVANGQLNALTTAGGALVMDGASVLNIGSVDTATGLAGLIPASGATINIGSQLTVNSNVDFTGVNLNTSSTGSLTLAASGQLTASGALSVANVLATGGSVSVAGLTVTNKLTVDGAPFYAAGAGTFDVSAAAVVVQNGGNLVIPGALTANSLTLNASTLSKAATADVTLTRGLTLTNASLDMGSGALTANSVSVTNGVLTTAASISVSTLSINGGTLAGGGAQATANYYFQNIPASNPTSSTVWGGAAAVMNIGGDGNLVVLSAPNTYGGATIIHAGALQATDGVGLPAGSNLQLNGGVFQSSGTFSRGLGTGSGQVQWAGDGGFAAAGGSLTVAMAGAPDPLVWGITPQFVSGRLYFGSNTADSEVVFAHNIDLNGFREIEVDNDQFAPGNFATLPGVLSDGGIRKMGRGQLNLTGPNTYIGQTLIDGGILQADEGQGLPVNSPLIVRNWTTSWDEGGVLQTHGTFTRNLTFDYNQAGGFVWEAGGFAAKGGKLTVTLNGGAPINWGTSMDGAPKVFGSITADSEVEVTNDIDLNTGWHDLVVNKNPNPAVTGDFATLSGAVTNGYLNKLGMGELKMTNAGNALHDFDIRYGTVTLNGNAGLAIDDAILVAVDNAGASATLNIRDNAQLHLQSAATLYIGFGYNPVNGVVNMNGGTLSQDGAPGSYQPWEAAIVVGCNYTATGTFNHNNGWVNSPNNGVVLGWVDGVIGTYNLNGGTLSTSKVQNGSTYGNGIGYFNFNGGVLQATQDNADFLPGIGPGMASPNPLAAATIEAGGAKIDTNGKNITIAQSLLHDVTGGSLDGGLLVTGGGTLTLSGTNTYTGGTVVTDGMLIIAKPYSILDGTSLTVGDPAAFAAPIVPQAAPVLSAAIAPVPEPGTLALLFSAVGIGLGAWYRRWLRARR